MPPLPRLCTSWVRNCRPPPCPCPAPHTACRAFLQGRRGASRTWTPLWTGSSSTRPRTQLSGGRFPVACAWSKVALCVQSHSPTSASSATPGAHSFKHGQTRLGCVSLPCFPLASWVDPLSAWLDRVLPGGRPLARATTVALDPAGPKALIEVKTALRAREGMERREDDRNAADFVLRDECVGLLRAARHARLTVRPLMQVGHCAGYRHPHAASLDSRGEGAPLDAAPAREHCIARYTSLPPTASPSSMLTRGPVGTGLRGIPTSLPAPGIVHTMWLLLLVGAWAAVRGGRTGADAVIVAWSLQRFAASSVACSPMAISPSDLCSQPHHPRLPRRRLHCRHSGSRCRSSGRDAAPGCAPLARSSLPCAAPHSTPPAAALKLLSVPSLTYHAWVSAAFARWRRSGDLPFRPPQGRQRSEKEEEGGGSAGPGTLLRCFAHRHDANSGSDRLTMVNIAFGAAAPDVDEVWLLAGVGLAIAHSHPFTPLLLRSSAAYALASLRRCPSAGTPTLSCAARRGSTGTASSSSAPAPWRMCPRRRSTSSSQLPPLPRSGPEARARPSAPF